MKLRCTLRIDEGVNVPLMVMLSKLVDDALAPEIVVFPPKTIVPELLLYVPLMERLPVSVQEEVGALKVPPLMVKEEVDTAFAPQLNAPALIVMPPEPILSDCPKVIAVEKFELLELRLKSEPEAGISSPVLKPKLPV